MLTLPASWETFWRMIALIITDQLRLGETTSGSGPLGKWICQIQGRPITVQRESVVRPVFPRVLTNSHRPRQWQFPPVPSALRPGGGYVFAQVEQCLVSFCTRADSRHTFVIMQARLPAF